MVIFVEEKSLQLRIVFDGIVPGLVDHRLSVSAFGDSLMFLLRAYRRIASGLLRDMLDTPEYGRAGGKYTEEAKTIDLEIFEIKGNSPLQVGFECTMRVPVGGQFVLPTEDFLGRVGKKFLEGIRAESQQELLNASVRKYLSSLPQGINRQSYTLERQGIEIDSVTITGMDLARMPDQLPYLEKIEGDVIGVGFSPGPIEVRIKQKGDSLITLVATEKQVTDALTLRRAPVKVLAVIGEIKRLLWIRPIDEPEIRPTYEETVQYIDGRWGRLLQRLAQ